MSIESSLQLEYTTGEYRCFVKLANARDRQVKQTFNYHSTFRQNTSAIIYRSERSIMLSQKLFIFCFWKLPSFKSVNSDQFSVHFHHVYILTVSDTLGGIIFCFMQGHPLRVTILTLF